jgi:type I restriction enzyme S subunit
MSAITAKASRKMKKYAVLTREPRCFLGSFDFSWEQRKLSEITDKVTEKNAGLQYVETFTNSAEFGIISQRDFFDHDIAKLGSLDGYYIVKNEDFVYNPRISTSAPVGPINRNKLGRTGVMSPLYTVFRPHDIDTTYLEYFFKCGYWHSFMNFNGDSGARSDRFSIRDNVFFQMPIPIPDIDEQRKIGELLTCLDNLITLHQRKFEKLTNVKKSMLEKMFPQNGSSYPEIRFKGFTDPWEQRKLGELVDVCSGRDYKHLSEGTIPVYGTGGYMLSVNDALSYDRDAIGIGRKGTIDRPYILKAPFWTVDTLFYAIPREKVDLNYAFDIFQNIDWKKKDESTGVPSLSKTAINDIDVLAPKHDEQQIIGQFFAAIDNLITLHQRELEKLQNIKKSMLEKMFV